MFICICNGVTERQIRDAIEEGAAYGSRPAARAWALPPAADAAPSSPRDLLSEARQTAAARLSKSSIAA